MRMQRYNIHDVRGKTTEILNRLNSNLGRAIWRHLEMKGTTVPRKIVANLLQELDPRGVSESYAL